MSKTASHFPIILLIIQHISDPTQEHRLNRQLRDLKREERNFVGSVKQHSYTEMSTLNKYLSLTLTIFWLSLITGNGNTIKYTTKK